MSGARRMALRMCAGSAVLLGAMVPLRGATNPTTTDLTIDDAHRAALPTNAMPVLSSVDAWVGVMGIVILAMFAMAAVIGPVSRANMPPEVPDAGGHGHDDSRGHGDAHGAGDSHGHGDPHGAGDDHGHGH